MSTLALTPIASNPQPRSRALLVASTVTVAPNGLSFTSVAEFGGPPWGGTALGHHNTGQLSPPRSAHQAFGAAIGVLDYPTAFAIASGFSARRRYNRPQGHRRLRSSASVGDTTANPHDRSRYEQT